MFESIMKGHVILEEESRDSLENLLDSLCAFSNQDPALEYPNKITLVGFEFKRERIMQHVEALRLPKGMVQYVR